jgi:hypothetical protein
MKWNEITQSILSGGRCFWGDARKYLWRKLAGWTRERWLKLRNHSINDFPLKICTTKCNRCDSSEVLHVSNEFSFQITRPIAFSILNLSPRKLLLFAQQSNICFNHYSSHNFCRNTFLGNNHKIFKPELRISFASNSHFKIIRFVEVFFWDSLCQIDDLE